MASKVIASSKFILAGSILSKISSFVGSILLARILFPEDYGYLTFTTVFTLFLQQIGNFGIEVFYLQEKVESKAEENGILQVVFKLRLMVNLTLLLIQNLIALVCWLYLDKVVVAQLLSIFSLTYIFEIFTSVNSAVLKKELNFKSIAIANTARDILSVVFRVWFAALGFGPLCFGFGAVIGSFAQMAVINYSHRITVDWKFWNREYFQRVYRFSKHVLVSSIGSYASQQIDKLLMISFFDLSKIGFYSFGFSNAGIPFTYVFSPQQQLILSYTVSLKDNPPLLLNRIHEIARIIILLTGPMYVFAYFNCDLIIATLFGIKWLPAAVYVRIFIVYFFFLSFLTPFNGLLTALGRPDVVSRITLYKLIVLIPSLILFSVFLPELRWYCVIFSVVSVVFDLIKADSGVRKIGGSVLFFLKTNADVFGLLLILSLLFTGLSETSGLSDWSGIALGVFLLGGFWLFFGLKVKDRQLFKKIFFKKK